MYMNAVSVKLAAQSSHCIQDGSHNTHTHTWIVWGLLPNILTKPINQFIWTKQIEQYDNIVSRTLQKDNLCCDWNIEQEKIPKYKDWKTQMT